ncbi:MAG: hypothetical protein JHC81_11150 [Brevundimonas sp.]|uniref:hypothetical protein n=1 Tax=Brevundimonas sp. TaxID=1871086 RepID=UPI001A265C71|nr:hypothetical protein [Brevundimonas sp.]MBJ7448081.1 hypothetical protein [Brevundimonas sp.]
MDTLARKIIDAIQNSLVGDLFWKLIWPFGYLWVTLTEEVAFSPSRSPLLGAYFIVLLAGFFLIWLLGTIAKTAPRPISVRHLSDRVIRPPENGFESWSQPPADGLRPPRIMRRIVETLGGSRSISEGRFAWLSLAFLIGILVLPISLVLFPNFWSEAHPVFASEPIRLILVQACLFVLVAFQIRQWATEQKRRLSTQDQPSVSTAMSPV